MAHDPGFPSATGALLAQLGRKYIWWDTADGSYFPPERIIAQVMNLGVYEDLRRLELALGPARLAEVMNCAQPGWFSPRSWEFWRGRLASFGFDVPQTPPRRRFDADAA